MDSSSSSASSASPFEYDVFLSFRGKDTRKTFTDHLYHALRRSGVRAFRDSEELQKGAKIDELFGVIERSQIFVPIFSENYAESEWCLKEIEKIVKVAECGEEKRLILPVFYRIEPTHVKNQTGPFEAAFRKHEEDEEVEVETVKEWREALKKATEFVGYESKKISNGHEAPLVEEILQRILGEVSNIPQDVVEHLVGIKSREDDIFSLLAVDSNDARMVGIHGMGGVGKTTVAKAVYNKIYRLFEFRGFIGDIREKSIGPEGLVRLQSQLVFEISKLSMTVSNTSEGTAILQKILQNKRVLIVLDDVDSAEQLQALAGKREWFHPGSRVVITTRDEQVLALHGWGQYEIYSPKELDEDESLKLFSWHAFGQNSPADGYEELSLKIVRALHGLPLAIETLASTLENNRDPKDWYGMMNSFRGLRDDRIYRTLKVSYDHLSTIDQRSIFLDVACFFNGIDKETAIYIWDACGFSSRLSINALLHKSLIKITNGKLEMHDLLREMGRRLVEEEPGTGPETRSRLWIQEEVMDVLEQKKGTSKIEGISLIKAQRGENENVLFDSDSDEKRPVEAAGFASMDKLRLLMINHVNVEGGYRNMPKRIKWLQWQRCPLKILPRDFHFKELAALDLSYSNIIKLRSNKGFGKLKFLDLTACNELKVTPELSAFPGLEKLVLDCCDNLVKVHESIADLKMLVVWSMRSCGKLKELPDCISHLTSLKVLNLANCLSLKRLPDCIGRLEELDVSNCTCLEEVPCSEIELASLEKLRLTGNPNLVPALASVDFETSNCASMEEVPESTSKVTALQKSRFKLATVKELQRTVSRNLKQPLKFLGRCCSCPRKFRKRRRAPHGLPTSNFPIYCVPPLESFPSDELPEFVCEYAGPPCRGSSDEPLKAHLDDHHLKELDLSGSRMQVLPVSISLQKNLHILHLDDCQLLAEVPEWIADLCLLEELSLSNCPLIKELPHTIGSLTNLRCLNISHCKRIQVLPDSIGDLGSLIELLLENNISLVELPESVGCLRKLEILHLGSCTQLERLPSSIGNLQSLTQLLLDGTSIMELPSSIASLEKQELLSVRGCVRLKQLPMELRKKLILVHG